MINICPYKGFCQKRCNLHKKNVHGQDLIYRAKPGRSPSQDYIDNLGLYIITCRKARLYPGDEYFYVFESSKANNMHPMRLSSDKNH